MTYIQGTRFRWKVPELSLYDRSEISLCAAEINISPIVAQVLCQRSLNTKEKIESFLFPQYTEKNHSSYLHDGEKAVERIARAVESKEKILIAGDYDVDGMTSTSLLLLSLLGLDANVNFHLPDRHKEGYGLSRAVVEKAAQSGYKLIITVDNGISAYEALERAQELKVDVIVTDHHQPQYPLPPAYAIVNPHKKECEYPFKELAGVGVIFKIVQLLYEKYEKDLPSQVYELLTLGTIADVVPLKDENRYWVLKGLSHIQSNKSLAFEVLGKNAKFSPARSLSSLDIGFSIAPQLNALGRLENPRKAISFLLGSEEQSVNDIGSKLFQLNQKRKELEKNVVQDVIKHIEGGLLLSRKETCIVASGNWQAGVLGLAASRLMNQYGVPSCILTETENGELKGSCRSIPECDFFDCLKSVSENIDISFGGHACAAGLSLHKKDLPLFISLLEKEVLKRCAVEDLQPKVELEMHVQSLDEINYKLWDDLQLLQPYGASNPFPSAYISHVYMDGQPQLLKERHVKITIQSAQYKRSVIFFDRPDLFDLLSNFSKPFSIAGKLNESIWREKRSIDIIGIDIAII